MVAHGLGQEQEYRGRPARTRASPCCACLGTQPSSSGRFSKRLSRIRERARPCGTLRDRLLEFDRALARQERRARLFAFGRTIAVRIDEQPVLGIDQANARPGLQRGRRQFCFLLRRAERLTAREARFERALDQHGLVLHVALESVEQLSFVQARELQAGDGHQHDHQIDDQEPRANAADAPPPAKRRTNDQRPAMPQASLAL